MKKVFVVIIIALVVCAAVGVVIKVVTPDVLTKSIKSYDVEVDIEHGVLDDITKLKTGSSVTVTLTAQEGYALPDSVSVTGATCVYDRATGNLTLSNPRGNVEIVVACVPLSWDITIVFSHGTMEGALSISTDSTANMTLSADTGYTLPSSIIVSGATYTYDSITGVVTLSAPTGDVTITGACVANTYTVTSTITNGTATGATTIATGGTASVTLTAASGYTLPSSITVSGATYTYDSITGVVALSAPIGNVIITAACVGDSSPTAVYGVSGLASSSKNLTRTDDAVGLTATVDSATGVCTSDFDTVFPWSVATVETINGNKMLHMPDMWFRVGVDGSNHLSTVAVSSEQGVVGDWYKVDSFYYSCYLGTQVDNKLASVGNNSIIYKDATRAQMRSLAQANGSGYGIVDLYHYRVMNMLFWIEFATKDSFSIFRGSYQASARVGGTDSLNSPSGFNPSEPKQMRWHYIEDFLGNYSMIVDGFAGDGTKGGSMYVSMDIDNFNDLGTNYNTLSYTGPTVNYTLCLKYLGWDSNNPFMCMPAETYSNSDWNAYFTDSASPNNLAVLTVGYSYTDSQSSGMTSSSTQGISDAYGCARLMYVPSLD